MDKRNVLDEIEQSLSDLSLGLNTWTKNLFLLAIFLFATTLLLFRTPIFLGLSLLLLVGAGLSTLALLRISRKRKKLKQRLDTYLSSPEGKISLQIRDISRSIKRFQEKLKSYELSLREGRKHLAQVKSVLLNDQLYENRKSKYLVLQESLEKSIHQQQMIMEFYQKAKTRYEKELFNLEQDIISLQMSSYLQKENAQQLQEEIRLHSTKFSLERYQEMEEFESHLPQSQAETLDWDLESQLKEMIEWLDHPDSNPDTSLEYET